MWQINERWTREADEFLLKHEGNSDKLVELGRSERALDIRLTLLKELHMGWTAEMDELCRQGYDVPHKSEKATKARRKFLEGSFYEWTKEDKIRAAKLYLTTDMSMAELCEEFKASENILRNRINSILKDHKEEIKNFIKSRTGKTPKSITRVMMKQYRKDREALVG